jgi:hypothetical protein
MEVIDLVWILKAPNFDDVDVYYFQAPLQGLAREVDARCKAPPIL